MPFWRPAKEDADIPDEQMVFGPARIEVHVQDWPEGHPGIALRMSDSAFLFSVEGAVRLRDALENQIGLAGGVDEARGLATTP